MVKKIVLYTVTVWIAFVVFMPKESLYFATEKYLKEQHVYINEKKIEEKPWGLSVDKGEIYVYGIPSAVFDKATATTLLVYNRLTVNALKVTNEMVKIPIEIERLVALYRIWDPLHIAFTMEGTQGHAAGSVDLRKRTLRIDFSDERKLGALKRFLHKDKKGWYYATSF